MPRKPPAIVDELPFLLIEEGVKKNRASERLRQYLVTKVSERAEIEMKYIKLLKGWIDDFNPFSNQEGGSEAYLDSEVMKKLITCVKNEVIHLMATRQKIYNDIMGDEGTLNNLVEFRVQCKNGKNLAHLIQEFAVINDRKKEISQQYQKHQDRKSHFSNEIDELERQMAQRSRIANNRRGSDRGAKRIDEMRNRLSVLRGLNDAEVEKISLLEKELSEIGTSTKMPLDALDEQLQELEDTRIRAILSHVKQFLIIIQGLNTHRGQPKPVDLEGLEGHLKAHWLDVKMNAKRTEAGEKFKLRELFTVKNQKQKVTFESETDGGRDSRMSYKDEMQSKKKSRFGPFFSRKSQKESETSSPVEDITEVVNRDSPSPEPYSADGRRSRLNFTEEYFKKGAKADDMRSPTDFDAKNGGVSLKTKSDESIEVLDLPPEILCPAEITRREPNKQFLAYKKPKFKLKDKKEKDITGPSTLPSEYSPVSDYNGEGSDENVCTELGKLRNIRVIAIQDNLVPSTGSELSFRKGQIIKQKVGRNEDGLCYGWTRDNPMGRKRYGYYRLAMVRQHGRKHESAEDNSD